MVPSTTVARGQLVERDCYRCCGDSRKSAGRVQGGMIDSQPWSYESTGSGVGSCASTSAWRCDVLAGESRRIRELRSLVADFAAVDSPLLISGEMGTGKELLARRIHSASRRSPGPFLVVACSLGDSPLETTLFGRRHDQGQLRFARGGTVFLHEIDALSQSMQVRLSMCLQERRAQEPRDVRIMAATTADLQQRVREKTFLEDLYYLVGVIPITLPPLRERREDIPVLVGHLLEAHARALGRSVLEIDRHAMACLVQHDWPGNIAELANVVERIAALEKGSRITTSSLPAHLRGETTAHETPGPTGCSLALSGMAASGFPSGFNLEQHLADIEDRCLRAALAEANGVRIDAARLLGLSYRSLRHLVKKHRL